MSKEY